MEQPRSACGFCGITVVNHPHGRRRRYCTPKHRVYDWRRRRRAASSAQKRRKAVS